jgi:enamine deaminase RidA (YjgF/YER057c/UK114 family)
MTITLTNPQGVPQVDFHHQVSIASGSKFVLMAGQVAWGADGTLIGVNDIAAQVEQCYLNVAAAPAGIGGSGRRRQIDHLRSWLVHGQDAHGRGGPRSSLRQTRCRYLHDTRNFGWCRRVVRPRGPRRSGDHRRSRLISNEAVRPAITRNCTMSSP